MIRERVAVLRRRAIESDDSALSSDTADVLRMSTRSFTEDARELLSHLSDNHLQSFILNGLQYCAEEQQFSGVSHPRVEHAVPLRRLEFVFVVVHTKQSL